MIKEDIGKFIICLLCIINVAYPVPVYIADRFRETNNIILRKISKDTNGVFEFWGWLSRKWNMGKWSEILEINIQESWKLDLEFVTTWSRIDAEWGVQRVGFIISCKKPNENRRSIYSETCLTIPYFKTSKLKSPRR